MFIKSIEIKNYRSFNYSWKIEFPDIKKPFTIIWANNSWKSNLINSILIWTWYKYMWDDSLDENDFFNQNISNQINIDLEINENEKLSFWSCGDYNESPKINYNWSYIKFDKKKEITSKIFYIDFQEISKLLKIKTDWSYTLLWKKIKEFRNKLKTNKEQLKEANLKVKELLKNDILWLDEDFKNFISSIEEFLKIHLHIKNEDFLVEFTILEIDKIINSLWFYISEDWKKPQLPIDNLWNWYKALIVSAILRAIAKDKDWWNIFIFEEPETFLHENFEDYFYNNILKELAKNNQVIITTHSKSFIDIFDYRTIIKIDNTGWQTNITQNLNLELAENCKNKFEEIKKLNYPDDFWLYAKSIDPNLNKIAFSKKVVIVEWPHDVLAYKLTLDTKYIEVEKFNEVWENIKEEIKDELIDWWLAFNWISIIPAHSKDIIWNLAVICYNLKIPFFIIFDYDLKKDVEVDFSDDILNKEYKNNHHHNEVYKKLETNWKQQYTKNLILWNVALKLWWKYHINKPKLEWVLNYEINDEEKLAYKNKSSESVFSKLKWKTLEEIKIEFPNFIPQDLIDFIK